MAAGLGGAMGDFAGGVAVAALVAGAFWNADRFVSESRRESLRRALGATGDADALAAAEAGLREALEARIGPQAPAARLFATALVCAATATAALFLVYLAATRGFLAQILSDGYAARLLLRQFLLSGLPSVFATTAAAFALQGMLLGPIARRGPLSLLPVVLGEIALKAAAFTLVTALSYVAFAGAFGSFGGSWRTAVAVVPETLLDAAGFTGLSSVYLYAALVSGFPLFLLLAVKTLLHAPRLAALWRLALAWLPVADRPIRAAVLMMAAFLGLAGVFAGLLIDSARLTGAFG